MSEVVLFSGNSNTLLSSKISEYLRIPLGEAYVGRFSDGESRVELKQNIRGRDVYIIQSTCFPANEHIMESAIIIDACRRASAKKITLVTPYFGYARQERKSVSRSPISAKLVADILQTTGIDRLVAVELHTSALQGFFHVPVDHLFAKPIFAKELEQLRGEDLVVVSPDAGGVERARALAKQFCCGLAVLDKRREQPNSSTVLHVVGDVENKRCLIVDDIVDTAGSLVNATQGLIEKGAREVCAAITHPVLSGQALERIQNSELKSLIVTDSIPLSEKARDNQKIRVVSLAPLVGEAIRRIHNLDSVSSLFL